MTKQHKALAAVITCVFFWGFSFVSIKIAVEVFPPMTLGALRFAIALIFLFFIKKKYAPDEKIQKSDIPLLAGAGLSGVTLYFFFENNGVSLIPASEASFIIAAIPIMTLIAETIGVKIASQRKRAATTPGTDGSGSAREASVFRRTVLPGLGALISLAGVALVAGVSFALSGTGLGYLYMAGACFSWVSYSFLTRPLFSHRSQVYIVFWQSAIGFLGFLPFAFFEPSWQMPGFSVWGHIIFLGICCSALGYWLFAHALDVLGVGTASMFINLIPVVSAIGGFFVLGERLQPLQWLGGALVLSGVYLVMAAPKISRNK
jgi:drug/metabolite transporter (DMT)-like permease